MLQLCSLNMVEFSNFWTKTFNFSYKKLATILEKKIILPKMEGIGI